MIYITGTKAEDIVKVDNGLDIVVLASSFCWFKSMELPTKSISKAKKIADHMLSDRPNGYDDIEVKKNNNKFDVYCYNKTAIESIIRTLKLADKNIYFTYELTNELMHLIDNNQFLEYAKTLTNKIKNKKPIIKLDIDKDSSTTKVMVINGFLVCAMALYIFTQNSILNQIDKKTKAIKDGGKSGYEIKSSIKSYLSKEKKNIKMKESLSKILKNEKNLGIIEYQKGKYSTKKYKGKS